MFVIMESEKFSGAKYTSRVRNASTNFKIHIDDLPSPKERSYSSSPKQSGDPALMPALYFGLLVFVLLMLKGMASHL